MRERAPTAAKHEGWEPAGKVTVARGKRAGVRWCALENSATFTPTQSLAGFLDQLDVELRNDLDGRPFLDCLEVQIRQ